MMRGVRYILFFLFGLQSCIVYTKTPVSIQDAVRIGTPTKVVSDQNHTYRFSKIVLVDNVYYGMNRKKSTVLYDNVFEGIYLKDKRKSILLNSIGFGCFFILTTGLVSFYAFSGFY